MIDILVLAFLFTPEKYTRTVGLEVADEYDTFG